MSDQPPSPATIPTAEQLNAAAQIDATALQKWGTIPADQMVVLHATRDDMDRLLLGLRMVTFGLGDTLEALNNIRHGDPDAVAAAYIRATNRNLQAVAHFTQFTNAIMAKAQADG